MKKVICVDANQYITKGKEYEVISETKDYYYLKNDNGNKCDLLKSRFRPVPEAEFQYGQEVEGEWKGQEKKGQYIATVTLLNGESRYLIQPPCTTLLDVCTSIRPVQSMREKVREYMDYNNIMIEDIQIDRIIELVKNEKI